MGCAKLGEVPVGSTVKIAVGGVDYDWLVVHQGLPGSMYDTSCDGTWLLMQRIYNTMVFDSGINDFRTAEIFTYLQNTFYPLIDESVRNQVKNVKIPCSYNGKNHPVISGANGLACKVFLLSDVEVNSGYHYYRNEGAKLSYFSGADTRIAYLSTGAAKSWWLRTLFDMLAGGKRFVDAEGKANGYRSDGVRGVRPCIILPADLAVDADRKVIVNTAPEINTESTVLGEQSAPFACGYTVSDADGDSLTVTEMLDGKTTATHTGITSGTTLTFEQASTEENFRRILNGSHTIQITADDGVDRTDAKVTFTKNVISASITLETPLAVEGDITVAVLQVSGDIPDDAAFKVEATNNANDSSPVWQDVSDEVKKGTNFVFENKTAANGAAFNFRISVARGASGTGGYIEAIIGAFQ